MSSNPINNRRIAKNTLFLYVRSLFVMLLNIYISRVVLQVLGVDDFGLYNVVGGFVLMLSVINLTLATACQRFIAYELGSEKPQVERVFATVCAIHFTLSLIVLILFETAGLFFVNNYMVVPAGKEYAVNIVYQLSVVTFCFGMFSIPFNASIIAYERMNIFAYISVLEATIKLFLVYSLLYVGKEKLIDYSLIMAFISFSTNLFYIYLTKIKCPGCIFSLRYDRSRVRSIMSFSKWNLIGSTAGVLNNQGISVLINQFFSLSCNASRAIAEQVSTAINTFVINFMMAINPQLTKAFASEDYLHMTELMYSGAKYASLLLWFLTLPILIDTEYILEMWLGKVPEYAVLFVRCALIYNMAQSFSQVLYQSMLASGKIKVYQLIVGTLSIMAFPCCYFFFEVGLGPEWGYYSTILFSFICLIARLVLLKKMIPLFSIIDYSWRALLPSFLVIILTGFIVLWVKTLYPTFNILGFLSTLFVSSLIVVLVGYFIGLNKKEKIIIISLIKKNVNISYIRTYI